MTMSDLHWLAGFLEGEGSFLSISNLSRNGKKRYWYPRISAASTDEDVIKRAGAIMNATVHGPYIRGTHKPCWHLQTVCSNAIGWMMTLYPLMGVRRQVKITQVLNTWKTGVPLSVVKES